MNKKNINVSSGARQGKGGGASQASDCCRCRDGLMPLPTHSGARRREGRKSVTGVKLSSSSRRSDAPADAFGCASGGRVEERCGLRVSDCHHLRDGPMPLPVIAPRRTTMRMGLGAGAFVGGGRMDQHRRGSDAPSMVKLVQSRSQTYLKINYTILRYATRESELCSSGVF
jgi:hypothetical protein